LYYKLFRDIFEEIEGVVYPIFEPVRTFINYSKEK
jgi:hypothetical protein